MSPRVNKHFFSWILNIWNSDHFKSTMRARSHLATTTWKFHVIRSSFCRQLQTVTLITMQPIFLSSEMGAAPIYWRQNLTKMILQHEISHRCRQMRTGLKLVDAHIICKRTRFRLWIKFFLFPDIKLPPIQISSQSPVVLIPYMSRTASLRLKTMELFVSFCNKSY